MPQLLDAGHHVTVYDTLLFGDGWLPRDNSNLTVIKGDVRDADAWAQACKDQEACIYFASISRELLCQQREAVANAVNVESFAPAVQIAYEQGIKRFIYASSVAVYGYSDHDAKETDQLLPMTARQPIYGRGKIACERVLAENYDSRQWCWTVTRSASVCGYSPRQRLDITVNRMVHDAYRKGVITVEGGSQKRSHVHILDLCDFYLMLLRVHDDAIKGQTFNVVAQNQTVLETAEVVARTMSGQVKRARNMPYINIVQAVDDRSYSVDGGKAKNELGFVPHRTIKQAVIELKEHFDAGEWPDSMTNPLYQNMADV